jgi:tripartite-type tricarboxylate transporter receptor subunit TctC
MRRPPKRNVDRTHRRLNVGTQAFVTLLAIALPAAGSAQGQNYPTKPVRIFAGDPGGLTDSTARIIATGLYPQLGQPVVVENRGSNLIGDIVAKAPPDGHTLLVSGSGLWQLPLMQKMAYDPIADFAPITLMVSGPHVLVVHPSVPVHSVKELIALARSRPGQLNAVSGPLGSPGQYAADLLKIMASVNIVSVPYRGSGSGMLPLIAGDLQLAFYPAAQVSPYLKSGKLRGLAVTSPEPSALAPELPTMEAAGGLPGYEAMSMIGIWAPARTPAFIIARLNQEIVRILNQPDIREKLFNSGAQVVGNTPDQFAEVIRSDTLRFAKVLKATGLKAD